jgi:DNA (cytosine-5)-methyltransferase 1
MNKPITFGAQMSNPQIDEDMVQTLQAKNPMAVAIQDVSGREKHQNGKGWNADGTAYTLDATATQGVAQIAIAYGVGESPDIAHCLRSGASRADKHESTTYVAQPIAPSLTASNDPSRSPQSSEVTQQVNAVYQAAMQVRRLTPRECERLQGFPDDYTLIPYRNKPACDGPRYKALGNSMAVPVMRWIGERIQRVQDLCDANKS